MVPPHDNVERVRQAVDRERRLGVAPGAAGEQPDLQPLGSDGGDAFLAAGERYGLVDELQLDGGEDVVYLLGDGGELRPPPVGLQPFPDGTPGPLGGAAEVDLTPGDIVGLQDLQVGAVQLRIIDMGLEESPVEVETHRPYGP
jgi:hypothetical protein